MAIMSKTIDFPCSDQPIHSNSRPVSSGEILGVENPVSE